MGRGHFGIGIYGSKFPANLGTLWRSAYCMGADYIFTIGKRYSGDSCDTTHAPRHVPLFHFETYEDFKRSKPIKSVTVAIENTTFFNKGRMVRPRSLESLTHPINASYILGAEDSGIPEDILKDIYHGGLIASFKSEQCLNVAVAGSIVLYDRQTKQNNSLTNRNVLIRSSHDKRSRL